MAMAMAREDDKAKRQPKHRGGNQAWRRQSNYSNRLTTALVDRFAVTTADIRGEGDFKRRVRCEPAGSRVNSTSCVDSGNGFGQE